MRSAYTLSPQLGNALGDATFSAPSLLTLQNLQFDKLTLTGTAGVTLKLPILGSVVDQQGTITWVYLSSGAARSAVTLSHPHPAQWRVLEHITTPAYAAFRAGAGARQAFAPGSATGISATTTVTSLLESNVYTYTAPSLAVDPATGHALLLWVHDDPAKQAGQSQEIAFSAWNGTQWSTPAALTNNMQPDDAPQVAWTSSGTAVAVWEHLDATPPLTATFDMTTATKIQLATATYSATTGAWSPVSLLTTNPALHTLPVIARNGSGRLLTVWHENAAGLLSGDAGHPDSIQAAFYTTGWAPTAIAVPAIPGLGDLAAGYGTGVATIAYSQLVTPTDSLSPTLQVFTTAWTGSAWGAPAQLTSDGLDHRDLQVVYNNANQPLVLWLAGPTLSLRNLVTGHIVTQTLPAELTGVQALRVTRDSAGNIAAIFTAQDAVHSGLYVAYYDQAHDTWGAPTRLTDQSASVRYPTAALASTGRLLAAYASTASLSQMVTTTISGTGQVVTSTVSTDGQTDLVTLSHLFRQNLTLSAADLALSADHPLPNDTVILSATVHNTGDLALAGVAVRFYDGDPAAGGTVIGASTLGAVLAAGSTATLTTTYTVPITGGVHALYALADPDNAIAEADEGDNTARLAAFGPDLRISTTSVQYWGGSAVALQAVIANIGTSAAPTSTISVYHDTLTGTLAITGSVPLLGPDQTVTVTLPWNYGALPAGSYPLVLAVNQANVPETNQAHNRPDQALPWRSPAWTSPWSGYADSRSTIGYAGGGQRARNRATTRGVNASSRQPAAYMFRWGGAP